MNPEYGYTPPEARENPIDTERLINNVSMAPEPLLNAIAEAHAARTAASHYRRVNLNNL